MRESFFLPADMAHALRAQNSTCRTPEAVRAAVRKGFLHPTGKTPSGVSVWSLEDAETDVWRDAIRVRRAHYLRVVIREPKQLKLTEE